MEYADNTLNALIILFYAMIGVCFGSFASAISYRISQGQSWIVDHNHSKGDGATAARSACPTCHHQLSFFDLIPLFSWIFLRGRCRYCAVPIPVRYPIIEFLGAVMMVVAYMAGLTWAWLVAFTVTLPFLLAYGALFFLKAKPPIYIYLLSFSNIFVLIYVVLCSNP